MANAHAELMLLVTAAGDEAIGYAEIFSCKIRKVICGSLSDETIEMVLMAGDRNEIAFFRAHDGKGEIELDFAPRPRAAGFDPFTGFKDSTGNPWNLISFRERREE